MAEKKPTNVHTGLVRLMYLHVWEPYAQEEGQKKKFSVQILIPKKDKTTLSAINKAIKAAREAGREKLGKIIESKFKLPLRDGDEEKDDDSNYKGMYFLSASSDVRPGIIDRDREDILDKQDLYSGCYGRVSLNMYAFNTNGNKGIAVGLNNIQKLKDGKRFDGRVSAQDDFDDDFDLGDDEDDFDEMDEQPKKSSKKPSKKLSSNDDYDDDEDDEEDEDYTPKKKSKSAPAKKKKRPVVEDDEDDEDF